MTSQDRNHEDDDLDMTVHLTLHTGREVKLRQIALGMQPLILMEPDGDGDLSVEVSGFDEKHLTEAIPDLLEFVANALRNGPQGEEDE